MTYLIGPDYLVGPSGHTLAQRFRFPLIFPTPRKEERQRKHRTAYRGSEWRLEGSIKIQREPFHWQILPLDFSSRDVVVVFLHRRKPEAIPSVWLGSLLLSPAGDPAEVNVYSYRPSHTRPRQRGTCITAKYTPTQGPTKLAPFLARHPSPFSPDSAEPPPPRARCSGTKERRVASE